MYYAIGSIVVKIQQRGIFHLVFNMEAILFVIKKKKHPRTIENMCPSMTPTTPNFRFVMKKVIY